MAALTWHRGRDGMGDVATYWAERGEVHASVWRSNVARGTWHWVVVSNDGRRIFGRGETELLAQAKRAAEHVIGGGQQRRRRHTHLLTGRHR